MSAKNNDKKNRWRSKNIAFRLSPEEAYQLDMQVQTSGMLKQDFILKRLMNEEITVMPNIRVQTYICKYLVELTEQLKRLEYIGNTDDVLDNIKYLLKLTDKLSEK